MLLAVDVGNTQTVLGVFDGEELVCHWRITTNKSDTADELHIKLHNLCALEPRVGMLSDLALASVVPTLTAVWCDLAEKLMIPVLVVKPSMDTGLPIRYDNPFEIGADRIADAVAAIHHYGAPVLVVDLGTATNIEVIDKDGVFVGGIIAPGFITSAEALFSAADRLTRVDLQTPKHAIGTNTRDAVQSGLVLGEVARIDGLVRYVFEELGYTAPVVATGGLADRVVPISTMITHENANLTIEGLRLLFERDSERGSAGERQ